MTRSHPLSHQTLGPYNTMEKIPINIKKKKKILLSFTGLSFSDLKRHSHRKVLGPRRQLQEELAGQLCTINPEQGLVFWNPIWSDGSHQEPRKPESQGQGGPAPYCSFKSICGEAQEAPLSLAISRQQRLEAKPALKASGGLAVTGIVRLDLTHIHLPAMFPCSPGKPRRCTPLKPGLQGRGC